MVLEQYQRRMRGFVRGTGPLAPRSHPSPQIQSNDISREAAPHAYCLRCKRNAPLPALGDHLGTRNFFSHRTAPHPRKARNRPVAPASSMPPCLKASPGLAGRRPGCSKPFARTSAPLTTAAPNAGYGELSAFALDVQAARHPTRRGDAKAWCFSCRRDLALALLVS